MKNFLLTFIPVSNITVTIALYKCVRSGSWTNDYNKEVQNFVQVLKRIKKLMPAENKLYLDRFQSFGQNEKDFRDGTWTTERTVPERTKGNRTNGRSRTNGT
ncbi:hypothetical protein C1645_819454 [Glomus cerebriforme]|uniref:Uncharacterized protein n=1 Tax=Glomus cerebriforme TaxID=658196 RepID=A0A397TER0_9GLOM|nr:hypothetical protein C1645_819454 [Glomus cerebriforme]